MSGVRRKIEDKIRCNRIVGELPLRPSRAFCLLFCLLCFRPAASVSVSHFSGCKQRHHADIVAWCFLNHH